MHSRPTVDGCPTIAPDAQLGQRVILQPFVHLDDCRIGDDTRIGTFVEIEKNVVIGARCYIAGHSFLCEGVTIEDEVLIGHGVIFINDPDPRGTCNERSPTEGQGKAMPTRVKRGAWVGSGAVILAGVTIGEGALVGAGAVVTKDVLPGTVVAGCPARFFRLRGPAKRCSSIREVQDLALE
jgi:UDP-2-acetamido-3-amino-2,3-dideoxy-glucuronate N-acetyltransferase